MKNILLVLCSSVLFLACNNTGKDSIEKADSINEKNLEKAPSAAIDEESSGFLVRVADANIGEVNVTGYAKENAFYQPVKDFAGMLNTAHNELNDKVKSLAAAKQVVLPSKISDDKMKDIEELYKKKGKDFDKAFLEMMVKNHEASITMFEKAVVEVKEAEVKVFAQQTIPVLKQHLDSAKILQQKY